MTAIARKASEKLSGRADVKAIDVDVLDAPALEKALAGHDAVFSAAHFATVPPAAIIEPAKRAGVKRLLVVGGAGSLYAAPGVQIVDLPDFPDQWKQGALAAREALNLIRLESSLDWTFLSPAPHLEPGERRGSYRVSLDTPVMDANGPAHVSTADLAVAIVDELERPQHIRRRFTVGY